VPADNNGVSESSLRPAGRRTFVKNVGLAGVALSAGLAGCTGSSGGNTATKTATATTSSPQSVVVGANFPLSGNLGYTGGLMADAVKLAATIRNENGGIQSLDGAKVEVVTGDNQAKQELGPQVTNELIDKGIDVLTGCWLSSVTLAAAQVAEQKKIPFVTAGAASASILADHNFNYVYRVQANTRDFGKDWAQLTPQLAKQQNVEAKTVGFFRPDNIFGEDIINAAKASAAKNGLEVIAETVIQVDGTDASSQATKLKGANPDIVAPTGYTSHGTLLMNAFQDLNYRPKIISAPACSTFGDTTVMKKQIGDYANGILDCNFAINPKDPLASDLKKRFAQEFDGNPLVAGAAVAYTSTYVMLEAIEKAGSTDPEKVNQSLKNIRVYKHPLAMPSPIEFEANGENKNAFAPLRQVQNFAPSIVWPQQFAGSSPISFGTPSS